MQQGLQAPRLQLHHVAGQTGNVHSHTAAHLVKLKFALGNDRGPAGTVAGLALRHISVQQSILIALPKEEMPQGLAQAQPTVLSAANTAARTAAAVGKGWIWVLRLRRCTSQQHLTLRD